MREGVRVCLCMDVRRSLQTQHSKTSVTHESLEDTEERNVKAPLREGGT